MPHRPNRTYVSNSDAFNEMAPIARDLLETASAAGERIPAEAFGAELQARAAISMDGVPAADWVGKVLDRVTRDAEARGERSLASLVVLRSPSTPSRSRATAERQAPRPRPLAESVQSSEVTCPNCWMIVPAAATCRSCGEPLPAPAS